MERLGMGRSTFRRRSCMNRMTLALVMAALCCGAPTEAGAERAEGKIVIAHRGASGYLPEHTLESYAMAHALGADYIEQDVVLTKDRRFICLHDIQLGATTNVKEVFPDRCRADGQWYAADFTLEEVKKLRARSRGRGRFPEGASAFRVPSLEESIELVQGLNQTTGRRVGIYPQPKQPSWHRKQGLPMEEALLAVLAEYGYKGPDARVFVQSFEAATLKRLRKELGSTLPQILLVGGKDPSVPLLRAEGLKAVAGYAEGIGPAKRLIEEQPQIVERAHAQGLAVHAYSFQKEFVSRKYGTLEKELEHFYFSCGVDGVFTDFPDITASVLSAAAKKK